MKSLLLLCLLAAIASGQVQHGRVATDFYGNVVLFETGAPLTGEPNVPTERIMEAGLGGVQTAAASRRDF